MGDIAECIFALFLAQRAASPIGELTGFVDMTVQCALNKIVVRDRIAKAERHRRDLRIKDRTGHMADEAVEDFKILPGSVENLHAAFFSDQLQEWTNVQILREGVNKALHTGRRCLHEAKPRPISMFTVELGINADEIAIGQLCAKSL